jgi:phosphomannomutase
MPKSTSKETAVRQIKFGTDGWRAIIADQFTFANLERVSQAYADFLVSGHSKKRPTHSARVSQHRDAPSVSIGYDNRFLSEQFAQRVAQVMLANDIDVQLFSRPVPTPLLSFAVKRGAHSGGVVITASHNPPEFNGFKIKSDWGGSAFDETTQKVELLVDRNPPKVAPAAPETEKPDGIWKRYKAHIHKLIDIGQIQNSNLKVVVDSMHGTGGTCIEQIIGEGGAAKVWTIRADRDPLFGGICPEPVDRNLDALKKEVLHRGATCGVATDGDADRLGVVNENGQTMTMHDVVPILLMHLMDCGARGKVVATVTQSVLLRRMARAYKLDFVETPVGFKYIAKEMLTSDVVIGAEESGGIGILGHIPERDGIFNALLFLEALAATRKKPTDLITEVHKQFGFFSFGRRDLHVTPADGQQFVTALQKKAPATIAGSKVTDIITMDGIKFTLDDDSWLMFRQSGTEPVLRVYAEGTSAEKTAELLRESQIMLKDFGIRKV